MLISCGPVSRPCCNRSLPNSLPIMLRFDRNGLDKDKIGWRHTKYPPPPTRRQTYGRLRILGVVLFVLFLLFHFGRGRKVPPGHPGMLIHSNAGKSDRTDKTPRIAVVTFITDQTSFMQLSLKNKDRAYTPDSFPRCCTTLKTSMN